MLDEVSMQPKRPVTMYCDNQPMVNTSEDFTGDMKRTRHFLRQIAFLKDYVKQGMVKFVFVETEANHVDMMTKALTRAEGYEKHRNVVLGCWYLK